MIYNPDVHTPLEMVRQIDSIYQRQPGAILVGSLGRMTAYASLTARPFTEFAAANLAVRADGTTRDIDVAGIDDSVLEDNSFIGNRPYTVDNFNCQYASLVCDGLNWYLTSRIKNYNAQLDSRVVEPQTTRFLGTTAVTLPPQTQLELLGIKGEREKDAVNRKLLGDAISTSRRPNLPHELYEPFEELKDLWRRDWVNHTREVYRRLMPRGVHQKLRPVHRTILESIGR